MTDKKTRLAFATGGTCLAIGLALIVPGIYFGVSERHESARLRDAGQTVEAHAVAKVGSAGRRYVRISYRFRTRENPQVHRVAGQKLVGWAFVVWIILGAIPGTLGGIMIGIGISRLRQR